MAAVGVAARNDLGDRAGLQVFVSGVEDLALADAAVGGPQVVGIAADAVEAGQRGGFAGLPVPWGSEVVIEGVIEGRKQEIEGPFGEFTGHYSGGRRMMVIRVDKISYRDDLIFEHLYIGMPWTELDYLLAANTCVPLYQQLKEDFPEMQAVNAMYTHGLVVIVSTEKRFGGFAKDVGLRVLTTPHGMGYAVIVIVIVVDEFVDPFTLPQVMWALSTRVNPAGDLIQVPKLPVLALAPQADPLAVVDKLIIDATTPVAPAPDIRGNYDEQVRDLPETREWMSRLQDFMAAD